MSAAEDLSGRWFKEPQNFTLPEGSLVTINGLPYATVGEVVVRGCHTPEWPESNSDGVVHSMSDD